MTPSGQNVIEFLKTLHGRERRRAIEVCATLIRDQFGDDHPWFFRTRDLIWDCSDHEKWNEYLNDLCVDQVLENQGISKLFQENIEKIRDYYVLEGKGAFFAKEEPQIFSINQSNNQSKLKSATTDQKKKGGPTTEKIPHIPNPVKHGHFYFMRGLTKEKVSEIVRYVKSCGIEKTSDLDLLATGQETKLLIPSLDSRTREMSSSQSVYIRLQNAYLMLLMTGVIDAAREEDTQMSELRSHPAQPVPISLVKTPKPVFQIIPGGGQTTPRRPFIQ